MAIEPDADGFSKGVLEVERWGVRLLLRLWGERERDGQGGRGGGEGVEGLGGMVGGEGGEGRMEGEDGGRIHREGGLKDVGGGCCVGGRAVTGVVLLRQVGEVM